MLGREEVRACPREAMLFICLLLEVLYVFMKCIVLQYNGDQFTTDGDQFTTDCGGRLTTDEPSSSVSE